MSYKDILIEMTPEERAGYGEMLLDQQREAGNIKEQLDFVYKEIINIKK